MNTPSQPIPIDIAFFPQMVSKLVKDGSQILSELTPEKCHLWHMATGLVGETIELMEATTLENKIEELGDIEFYSEGIRQAVGITMKDILSSTFISPQHPAAEAATIAAGWVLDAVKKHVAYNKPLNLESLITSLALCHFCVTMFTSQCGLTRNDVLKANMDKLSKRYPNFNFTNEAAQKRADKESTH